MKFISQKTTLLVIGIVLSSLLVGLAYPNGYKEVNRKPQFIGVVELAEKIRNGEDLQLIDLRRPSSYEEFHIPTAINIPMDQLKINELEGPLIFYSGDDLIARKVWHYLPDSIRQRSRVVYGGIHDWYDRVLYPTLPYGEEVASSKLLQQVHHLSQFYGGYADFEDDPSLMNYYLLNLQTIAWPKATRSGSLVRKGC